MYVSTRFFFFNRREVSLFEPQIAIWYNTSKPAQQLAQEITKQYNVQAKTYQVDVRSYGAVEAAVAQVHSDFGRLDVMIANAGVPSKAGGLDDAVEDWDRVRAIDFDGAYYCLHAAGRLFREQGHGVGIVTASMSGHAANVPQEQSCYNACKAGVVCEPSVFINLRFSMELMAGDRIRFILQSRFRSSGPNGAAVSTLSRRDTSTQRSQETVRGR